jgi:hypothetical protein
MKDTSDYLITQQFTPTIEKIIIELNLRASSCFSSSANVTVYFVLQRPWFYLFSDFFLHLINLGLWYAQITFHANIQLYNDFFYRGCELLSNQVIRCIFHYFRKVLMNNQRIHIWIFILLELKIGRRVMD